MIQDFPAPVILITGDELRRWVLVRLLSRVVSGCYGVVETGCDRGRADEN